MNRTIVPCVTGLLLLAGTGPSWGDDKPVAPPEGATIIAPKPTEEDPEIKKLKGELERLKLEQELAAARHAKTLAEAEQREKELSVKNKLRQTERESESFGTKQELEKLKADLEKLKADRELLEIRDKDALRDLQLKGEQLRAHNDLIAQEVAASKHKLEAAQIAGNQATADITTQTAVYNGMLEQLKKRQEVQSRVFREIEHPAQPFQDGVLRISDRRIELNGPIITGTADFVTERIHYFNNLSDAPVFIVINDSPGGSVMEGYRIVKAIQSSKAPVHVVVKSFAASMAAVITTLAPHSYCYPNAIVLHHQMWSVLFGNPTQMQQQLDEMKEWARRLSDPVAAKMGVSPEQFVKMMYEHNVDGDWYEFGDKAQKLKWVDHLVDEIREEGLTDRPTSTKPVFRWFMEYEQTDEKTGKKSFKLPRLNPFDFYAIHNPDGYYVK